ncbi:aldehyde dehydrogenase family protein [Oricola indica]|uniref:aldehyde dehydrogenase family protein n=1 Tax=Oricola indica TaxID=2872591 RepID=UPI003CCB84FB
MTIQDVAAPGQSGDGEAFVRRDQMLFIGGKHVPPVSGQMLDVEDPSSGEVLGRVAEGDKADVDAAVMAARRAFEGPWSEMSPSERSRIIWRLADLILDHAGELATINTLENGKPIGDSLNGEVPFTADVFRYYAGWATKLNGETMTVSAPGNWHTYTRREPIGVTAQIIPWNFPLAMLAWKVAPALATGCTIVLKPAEQTPIGALRLAELAMEAGLPEGVLNVVTGYGAMAGAALSAHPGVDKIAFTGSTATGRAIATAAIGNLKKVSLELGGKAPTIILPDADLDMAIAGAASGSFFNAGQSCGAGTRLYVHRDVYDRVVEGVAEQGAAMQMGAGIDPATQLGPVVSQKQQSRIFRILEEGRDEGAEVVCGGFAPNREGYFVSPTIVGNVRSSMAVMREEVFGPVVCAIPFDDDGLDEVARAANDTEYGLASAIWTNDLSKAHRLAAKIKAGTVWVNTHNFNDVTMPFGGFKQSGWGRDLGAQALDLYTETKTVAMRLP